MPPWERQPHLRSHQAAVTQLANMLDEWEPTHRLLRHPPERVKAHMPKTGMPQPRLLSHLRREAHRLYESKIEDVEPVARPLHLGEEHTIVDKDLHSQSSSWLMLTMLDRSRRMK